MCSTCEGLKGRAPKRDLLVRFRTVGDSTQQQANSVDEIANFNLLDEEKHSLVLRGHSTAAESFLPGRFFEPLA